MTSLESYWTSHDLNDLGDGMDTPEEGVRMRKDENWARMLLPFRVFGSNNSRAEHHERRFSLDLFDRLKIGV